MFSTPQAPSAPQGEAPQGEGEPAAAAAPAATGAAPAAPAAAPAAGETPKPLDMNGGGGAGGEYGESHLFLTWTLLA